MDYNLTENQKDFLRWLVQQVRKEELPEEFHVLWVVGGAQIMEYRGEHPEITRGILDALANAGLMLCAPDYHNETSVWDNGIRPTTHHRRVETTRRCTMTGEAFDAVDNDFELPAEATPQVTIGAMIHSMSGGSVQAVGIARDAEISQVVNDPDLLRSQVDALAENLLNEVKSWLNVDDLAQYAQALRDLKEQLLLEKPQPPLIRQLVRTVGLLGDIEGTIGLMTRVWTLLHPLLLITAARIG